METNISFGGSSLNCERAFYGLADNMGAQGPYDFSKGLTEAVQTALDSLENRRALTDVMRQVFGSLTSFCGLTPIPDPNTFLKTNSADDLPQNAVRYATPSSYLGFAFQACLGDTPGQINCNKMVMPYFEMASVSNWTKGIADLNHHKVAHAHHHNGPENELRTLSEWVHSGEPIQASFFGGSEDQWLTLKGESPQKCMGTQDANQCQDDLLRRVFVSNIAPRVAQLITEVLGGIAHLCSLPSFTAPIASEDVDSIYYASKTPIMRSGMDVIVRLCQRGYIYLGGQKRQEACVSHPMIPHHRQVDDLRKLGVITSSSRSEAPAFLIARIDEMFNRIELEVIGPFKTTLAKRNMTKSDLNNLKVFFAGNASTIEGLSFLPSFMRDPEQTEWALLDRE